MDFGIAAIHHGERVADLRTAGDVAEVVSPIGKDRGHPVGLARPGGRRETQRKTEHNQERIASGPLPPFRPGQDRRLSAKVGPQPGR